MCELREELLSKAEDDSYFQDFSENLSEIELSKECPEENIPEGNLGQDCKFVILVVRSVVFLRN